MNSTGSNDKAMAPTTILVLKRAPSCSLLRSAQRRSTVRVRIKRKTSRAAVIMLETAYRAIASRQFFGSKGTSSEPNVNTAASSNVASAAPMPNVQRCFGSSELIEKPALPAVEKNAAGIRSSEDCECGSTPCRCEQSGRGIHYTAARHVKGCVQRAGGFLRRSVQAWQVDAVPAAAACRRRLRIPGALPHRAGWSPPFAGQCHVRREVSRAAPLWAFETFFAANRRTPIEEIARSISAFWLSVESSRRSE